MSEDKQQQQQQMKLKHFQQKQNSELGRSKEEKLNASPSPNTQKKLNIHLMRNQDFINRLVAATPPYFYSPAVGNTFFFSDLLRGLVAERQTENMRQLQLQQQHQHQQQQQQQQQQHTALLARRSLKRLWSTQHRPYLDRKEMDEKQIEPPSAKATPPSTADKPLELTNKSYMHFANAGQRKLNENHNEQKALPEHKEQTIIEAQSEAAVQNTPPPASLPPQDLVLPPPPPVWYPPVYPPYVFDPLHFFIDLRVSGISGHIYDRKKENVSPLSNNEENLNANNAESSDTSGSTVINLPNKQRHGSAFTVPTPRSSDVLNLSANAAKYYDLTESKENNHPLIKHNTNYMLQQLPRFCSQLAANESPMSNYADRNFMNDNIDIGNNHNDNVSSTVDNKTDSDGRASIENSIDNCNRDIDVEIVESIKCRTDAESSRCSSADDTTQID